MGDILKSILLGILEGITEFLPISSTGHLIVATQLLNFRAQSQQFQHTFEIFIQVGAIVAVILYYASDLIQQARTMNDERVQQWWLAIVVAAIPGLVIGFLFHDKIEAVLLRPSVVGMSMIVGGLFIWATEIYQARRALTPATVPPVSTEPPPTATEGRVTLPQALVIGLFQVLALIPGMSRSAMTIIGGLCAGLSRQTATRFSFYLAIPVLGSATLYALIKDLSNINSDDLLLLIIGAVVSGIVAWGVIAWLLRYVARHNFVPFAVYRILVGILILGLVAAGRLAS